MPFGVAACLLGVLASEAPVCSGYIRMRCIAPPRQAQTRIERARSDRKRAWAKVRVCVHAENRTVAVCSAYICVFASCVYARVCLCA
jgi:hypothetical protein